jgi:hypothetical protein
MSTLFAILFWYAFFRTCLMFFIFVAVKKGRELQQLAARRR